MKENMTSKHTLTAILIDDEKDSLEGLEIMLSRYCPHVRVMSMCQGPVKGMECIHKHRPDLVFLDIEMPVMNGFEMLEALDTIDFDIIFITAYDEFAIKAFKVSAMDYLLKPVGEEELIQAVAKVDQKRQQLKVGQVDVLLTNLKNSEEGFTKIALPSMEGLDFINIDDILHCEADSNYTTIFTVHDERFTISRTLKEFEEMLSSTSFIRTHQSHLINLNHIKKYIKGSGGEVVLSDGTHIQVARARKENLIQRIYNH